MSYKMHPKMKKKLKDYATRKRKPRPQQRMVSRLREQLWTMVRIASYVCAHNYEKNAPVGTRVVAVEDLRAVTRETIDLLNGG